MSKTTKAAWIKRKRHEVTLPSGTEVAIELPNLPLMLKTGQIPNHLVDAAIEQQNAGSVTVTREMIESQHDYYAFLVSQTVKEPEVTPDDVKELPYEDVEMIVEFANRLRDMDAVYKHLGGLETQASFREFRGLGDGA